MAVAKATLIGAVAALALPYAMRGQPDALGGWAHRGVVSFAVTDWHFAWSWPIFCIVTLFAWACFSWADR